MMEVENYLPEPDEFNHHDDTEEKQHRLQFSLLRGYSVQEPQDFVFPASSCRRRSIERILGAVPRPISNSREAIISSNQKLDELETVTEDEEPVVQTRRATISSGTTILNPYKRYGKHNHKLRDWPLGEPKLKNEDDFFELELSIGEFKPEEVSAKVVGKDLIIHCKPDIDIRREAKENVPNEIFRCYSLPLETPPVGSDVSIVKDDAWIRVAIRQESGLKSPIGIYTPEMAQVLEEEQVDDVEAEEEEDERMDGD